LSQTLIKKTQEILIKKKLTVVKPRPKTVKIETRTRSRKPLRNMASFREEDDCLFFKKYFPDTGTQLILQQPAYVRGLSKDRVRMYACRPTAGRVHLCNFSKKKTNSQANQAGSTGMEDQNPLKTQKLTETQETVNKPIKDTQKTKIP
jgi:hypothetical protein